VDLLGEMLCGIDRLHVVPRETGEVEYSGQLDSLGLRDLVVASDDVEPHVRELAACHTRLDGEAPSRPARFIESDRCRLADQKFETVFLSSNGQAIDQQLADRRPVTLHITKGEVEVAGAASSISEPYLEGHASLDDPPEGCAELESHEEAFERSAAAEALEVDPGLPRPVAKAGLKCLPERCR
jgi:hypothetical protein